MFATGSGLSSRYAERTIRITRAGDQPGHHNELAADGAGVTVGRYRLQLGSEDNAILSCWDTTEGKFRRCRVYSLAKLMVLAPLLFSNLEGLRQVEDVCVVGDEAFLVYPDTHGDLHGYLKQRRKLLEVEAAHCFSQIVDMLRSAHSHSIVLRDLKLKKFIFADVDR